MTALILNIIDFFYPPFKRIMPLQTFRYAACGGGNMVLGLLIFAGMFHWVVNQHTVHLGFVTLEPYSASLIVSSTTIFFVGFLLNKYVVFTESDLKGRVQLFRYFLSFIFNLVLNYLLLKLLVKHLGLQPVVSQCIVTVIVVGVSYVTQRYFTFKTSSDTASEPIG